ncbi:terminase small subunit [Enterococcus sp. AZ109]|uniref:terminase small subunit n=1 Tax=Enterococcus sp. AZ109 TaxID=2774634 RepID=UPI003F299A6F
MTAHQERLIAELTSIANDLMGQWPLARNKQKKFILAYVANGFVNASEAAKKAGYSEKTANTVASNMMTGMKKYEHIPPIIEELKKAFDERTAELSIASGTEILQYLTAVMRGEETETIATARGVYLDVDVGAKDRLKAAELLGKRHALFIDKIDVNANVSTEKFDDIVRQLGGEGLDE